MKGITRENLKDFTKAELIEVCMLLANTEDIKVQGLKGYAKQLKDMANFLNKESLVEGIDDKEDKTWDRGHKIMENFGKYQRNLSELEEEFIPEKKETITKLSASQKGFLGLSED